MPSVTCAIRGQSSPLTRDQPTTGPADYGPDRLAKGAERLTKGAERLTKGRNAPASFPPLTIM
jgi:hypothetical protein